MLGISRRLVPAYAGIRLVEDALLVDHVEEWSQVRSPGRARRRRRQGHPQRIRIVAVPKREIIHLEAQGVLIAHPVVIAEMRRRLADAGRALKGAIEGQTIAALRGQGGRE